MRYLRFLASLAMMLLAALPIKAQTESEAFYIYQNDGHFDGFFYDEIVKMNFSFLDTLGIEHDEIVSQEIVTADSTYRFMLSAIDSIGFVQPEILYGPQVYIKGKDPYFELAVRYHGGYSENEIIVFSSSIDSGNYYYDPKKDDVVPIPLPQVGDIFASFDVKDGFMCKISELTRDYPGWEGTLVGYCKPIDDISEVFQQFVSVEEYGYADDGTMVRRRVAGRPELSIGEFPKRSPKRAPGQWEGDLFNFSMNSNLPLYSDDNLNINIITAIDGKLHVKTAWNFPLFGDKYISIDTKLNFGVAGGFSIDGSISKTFESGLGNLGSIPIPAACPLFIITIGPDVFLRGEAHVNFAYMPRKTNGSFWTKLEIRNWVPSMNMGFGTPKGEEKEGVDVYRRSTTLSLNGFVQAGLQFPLTFGSLPTFKKFFNFSAGSKVYLGPKLGADFTIDLNKFEIYPGEITSINMLTLKKNFYNTLLNTTFQFHMLDVDFDIKSKMETAFSGVKEATLFSGSASLLPAIDMSFVPEFGACEEFTEDNFIESDYYGDQVLKCRVFAFKPSGLVIKPVDIRAQIVSRIKDDGTEVYDDNNMMPRSSYQKYYDVLELLGQDLPKEKWARLVIPYRKGRNYSILNGKFKVSPSVLLLDREGIGSEEYVFEHGAILHVKGRSRYEGGNIYTDELYLNADGTPSDKPFEITGNCDSLVYYSDMSSPRGGSMESFSEYLKELQLVGSGGNITIQGHPDNFKKSFNPCDTLRMYPYIGRNGIPYGGVKTIEGEFFESFLTEKRQLKIYILPNDKDPSTCVIKERSNGAIIEKSVPMTVSRNEDGRGWHIVVDYDNGNDMIKADFNVWYGEEGTPPAKIEDNYVSKHGRLNNLTISSSSGSMTYKITSSDISFPTDPTCLSVRISGTADKFWKSSEYYGSERFEKTFDLRF